MELEDLSIVEKAAMLSGGSEWDSRGNDRADIPGFVMSDGPHGVRRQLGEGDHLGIGASKPATCFPTACTVANTWDPALAEEMGEALGKEAHDLDVNVLLGPGMNVKRNPLCGRNYEYYSEDPLITGKMAAAYVRGMQSKPGVGATIKHFCCNNQEDNRMGVSANVSPLTWFEASVNYALSNFGSTGGLMLNFHPRGFNFFVAADVPLCKYTKPSLSLPLNRFSANINLGINFTFGPKYKTKHRCVEVQSL